MCLDSKKIELALVNVRKFNDIINILLLYLAYSNNIKLDIIGQSIDLNSVKIARKLKSMHVSSYKEAIKDIDYFDNLFLLKEKRYGQRLIATTAAKQQAYLDYDYHYGDIIVIGGANGLSKKEITLSDNELSISTSNNLSFLKSDIVAIMIVTKALDLL